MGVMFWLRLAFVVLLLPFIALGVLWMMWGRGLPAITTLDALEYSGTTRVYDMNSKLATTLTPSGGRRGGQLKMLTLDQMGPWAAKAVMESEDRRFYEHGGVDFMGITRGLLKGIFKQDLEGGSSITQQVVKNTLLSDLNSARTLERKFKEALLASRLEKRFSKKEILQVYMNLVYWGNGGSNDIMGIDDAAKAYFRKPAAQLNLAESVYLATIIPAPNKRYKEFTDYRPLVKNLLGRMVEDKQITRAQATQAWNTPIYPSGWRIDWGEDGKVNSATLADETSLARNAPHSDNTQGYYYWQGLQQQLTQLGSHLYDGGKVYSTYDAQAQNASERASLNVSRIPRGATLGIALLDPQNGEVRALVGQRLFYNQSPNEWNNAMQAKRQVGSSIKPLLYTLALSKGWKQSDRVLDSPIDDKDYQPQNYDGTYLGVPVTLRYALDHSLNLPTVRLGKELGMDTFSAKLRELGLSPGSDLGLSLAIGTLEASPLQMAAAYAPFANGGIYHTPSFVRRTENGLGEVTYKRPQSELAGTRVWDPQTAWLGLDMIRGVVNDLDSDQGGLATRARIDGWEVGGKTGTTNDIKDLWFVGTTSRLTGAVWVGKQAGGSLPEWAYSGTIPAPIWQQSMQGALRGVASAAFKEPSGIDYRVVRRVKMAFRAEPAAAPVAQPETPRRSWWPFSLGRRSENSSAAVAPATPPTEQPAAQPTTQPTNTQPTNTEPTNTQSTNTQPADSQPTPSEPTSSQPVTTPPVPVNPNSVTLQPAPSGQDAAPTDSGRTVQFDGNSGHVEVAPASPQ